VLTPLEIQNKKFKKGAFGYIKEDVDIFFNLIYEEYDRLYMDNIALRDKIGTLSDAIAQYKALEETLQNTLIVAQSTGEEVKRVAYDKSDAIMHDAQLKAAQIIEDANREVTAILAKRDKMQRDLNVFKTRTTTLIRTQLEMLDDIPNKDDGN